MASRIYDFERHKSNAGERDELAEAIREITPAVKTIAEEAHRHSMIRALRMIARRDRRGAERGPGRPS